MLDGIKAIYFDLDNTLIDRNAAHTACIEQFFDEFLPNFYFDNEQFDIEEADNWGYTLRSEFCEWFFQRYMPSGWDEASFWNYLQTNISNFVPPISEKLNQQLLELKKHYRIGIITNGSISNQSRKIQKAKLDSIFESENIHISQQYQLAKPDKAFFDIIMEQWGLKPEEVLYLGDDPRNDIKGGAAAGIKTCWVSYRREWNRSLQPNYIIDNLSDFFTARSI